jgi:2-dehydro-3-deoxyphosphogluconate aldolase / (4S)-4-hydroxy-2-oxoglutarate aldolase
MLATGLKHFDETPAVVTLRGLDSSHVPYVAEAALDSQLRTIEFTSDTTGYLEGIRAISGGYGNELHVGCGTIRCLDQAKDALQAGADFLVSPWRVDEVCEWADNEDVLYIPGGMTPTELGRLYDDYGFMTLKVFPASIGGPELIRQLRGPLRRSWPGG